MTTTQVDAAAAWLAHVGADAAPAGVVPQPRNQQADAAVDAELGSLVAAPEVPTQRSPLVDEAAAALALLWVDLKDKGCATARQNLILHYAPLVSAVAGRVGMRLPSTVEHADLVSYGMFGLIDAIEKYETDRAVKFESYASSRIRGAIIDELRAMDWVPRSVRTKARAVDRAHAELEAKLHRAPTEIEIARHMQVPLADLRAVYSQLSSVNIAALDELLGGGEERVGGVSLVDTLGDDRSQDPAGSVEAAETSFLLSRAIEQLGERERIVVVMYYYEGLTLAEIGRVLGVTESRISQMHTAAMLRLRSRLTAAGV
ncbi:FliA/WhiG family RNA polymerase sigma factor [Cellulomonas sp. PhB150]|uniref:FliA/WhiG family RNA polymerase sigma factor n=1 Tax=Cellulomonas sp. PhB150 TaxID=2485188 RepID=UPI000F9DADA9|nr:FliA/WhiG family RNA polymerase sigma factor [Cellulomonas sp. PhB150]ROS28096.1 RNA polymerase sigma-28 (SigD/FliA/WhiG) subunit [Cellulomonas sp. PhB150]